MSTEEPETKLPTLNPLFLQAVRDEVAKRQKAGQAEQQAVNPISAFAINEPKAETDAAAQEQSGTFELFQQPRPVIATGGPEIAEEDKQKPPGNLAAAKAAIAGKQAEIDQAQQQFDRLIKIKAVVEPADSPATGRANLNELRLKRLAIQMALVADNKEYDDKDLLAVDRQIAKLSGLATSNRQSDTPANAVERMKLNAKIDEFRDKVQVLTEELNRQIADYNLSVAFKKAESYVQTLKAACDLRHELLVLVELLASDGLLIDLKLGGELPMPSGFEPFDSILQDTLATTIEGIEEAKASIRQEILP